jgi:flagellar basal-body rod modification protein FlgD
VDDKEFIAQLAQFSSLEQMQNLNTNMSEMMLAQQKLTSLGQAMQMIGKEVELFTQEGESLFGRVTGVQFRNGWPEIIVGGKLYDFTEVVAIKEEVKDDSTV